MISIKVEESGSYELAPAGQHTAVCYGVYDLGHQQKKKYGTDEFESKRIVRFVWELVGEEGKMADGKPFVVSREYNATYHPKGMLRKHIEAWRGKPFESEADLRNFSVEKVIGKPCLLTVVHSSGERVYANVENITQLPKAMLQSIPKKIHNEFVEFSFEPFNQSVFDSLPDFLKEKIKKSPEYQQEMVKANNGHPVKTSEGDVETIDDEIPF